MPSRTVPDTFRGADRRAATLLHMRHGATAEQLQRLAEAKQSRPKKPLLKLAVELELVDEDAAKQIAKGSAVRCGEFACGATRS